jgi:hypothetical protein
MQFSPFGLLDPCGGDGFAVLKRRQPAAILCRCHEIWEPYLPGALWTTAGL